MSLLKKSDFALRFSHVFLLFFVTETFPLLNKHTAIHDPVSSPHRLVTRPFSSRAQELWCSRLWRNGEAPGRTLEG